MRRLYVQVLGHSTITKQYVLNTSQLYVTSPTRNYQTTQTLSTTLNVSSANSQLLKSYNFLFFKKLEIDQGIQESTVEILQLSLVKKKGGN